MSVGFFSKMFYIKIQRVFKASSQIVGIIVQYLLFKPLILNFLSFLTKAAEPELLLSFPESQFPGMYFGCSDTVVNLANKRNAVTEFMQ